MTYYKVLPQFDGCARKDGSAVLAGELYTKTEMKRYRICENYVKPVVMPKSITMWFGGARWQKGKVGIEE